MFLVSNMTLKLMILVCIFLYVCADNLRTLKQTDQYKDMSIISRDTKLIDQYKDIHIIWTTNSLT